MADLLLINGERVDMPVTDQAGISIAVNDLSDMGSRQGSFTPTVKLPKTDNNIRIFESCFSSVSASRLPYTKNRADYFSGGTQLIADGVAVVQDAGKEINLNIFSSNATFFQLIDGKKLSELDLSAFDLIWNHSNVVACYGNNQTPLTALISDGNLTGEDREINTKKMFFHVYLSDIINAIITDAGFTKSGSIFSDANYLNKILTFSYEYPRQGFAEMEESATRLYGKNDAYTVLQSSSMKMVYIDASSPLGYDANSNYNTTTGVYTVPHGGRINVKGHQVVDDVWDGSPSVFTTFMKLYVNGVEAASYAGINSTTVFENDTNYIDWSLQAEVEAGDTVEIYFSWSQPFGNHHNFGLLDTSDSGSRSWIQFDLDEELLWGNLWHISRNLPDWTQKDVLKMFVAIFGQSFQVDDFSKEIKFFTIDEVIENKGSQYSHDWSAYYESGTATIKFHSTYSKVNDCVFTKDDTVAEFTGDSSFDVSDETLKERGEAIKIPVSPSQNVRRMRGIFMAEVLRLDNEGNTVTPKPRLLSFINTPFPPPNTNDFVRLYEDGTANTNDFFTANVLLFDFGFTEILNGYYQGWLSVLNDYKAVQAVFLLPASAVAGFDFSYPVYVKGLSSWFYVNLIENYKSGKKCKVELIQV